MEQLVLIGLLDAISNRIPLCEKKIAEKILKIRPAHHCSQTPRSSFGCDVTPKERINSVAEAGLPSTNLANKEDIGTWHIEPNSWRIARHLRLQAVQVLERQSDNRNVQLKRTLLWTKALCDIVMWYRPSILSSLAQLSARVDQLQVGELL